MKAILEKEIWYNVRYQCKGEGSFDYVESFLSFSKAKAFTRECLKCEDRDKNDKYSVEIEIGDTLTTIGIYTV